MIRETSFQRELTVLAKLRDETQNSHSQQAWWISLDEVGRGSVAGPVMACATLWRARPTHAGTLSPCQKLSSFFESHIKDSKRLSEKRRESAATALMDCLNQNMTTPSMRLEALNVQQLRAGIDSLSPSVLVRPQRTLSFESLGQQSSRLPEMVIDLVGLALGHASAIEIDTYNIWEATQLAISRALMLLKLEGQTSFILFDGKLPSKVPQAFKGTPFVTAISGDAHFKSIASSSIVAKVLRDRHMSEVAATVSGFSLEKNKGYGTVDHLQAIERLGLSAEHRRSFLSRFLDQQTLSPITAPSARANLESQKNASLR